MTTPPDDTVSRDVPATIPEAHELVEKMRDDFRMGGFKVGDVARLLAFVIALPATPPAADELPALRGLLALFERLAADRGATLGYREVFQHAANHVMVAIADLEKATEGRVPVEPALPVAADFDPFAPIDSLPAEIRQDIATERGMVAPPAVGEHAALLARADELAGTSGAAPWSTIRELAAALRASEARREKAERRAYLGEHHFDDLTYKARLDELVPKFRKLEADLARERDTARAELKAAQEKLAAIEAVPLDEPTVYGIFREARNAGPVMNCDVRGSVAVARSLIAASMTEVAIEAFRVGDEEQPTGTKEAVRVAAGLRALWSAVAPALAASPPDDGDALLTKHAKAALQMVLDLSSEATEEVIIEEVTRLKQLEMGEAVAACAVTDELVEEARHVHAEAFRAAGGDFRRGPDGCTAAGARAVLELAAARCGAGDGGGVRVLVRRARCAERG